MAVDSVMQRAREIYDDVVARGDSAVREFTAKFDGPVLERLSVSPEEIRQSYDQVKPSQVKAIRLMKDRLSRVELALYKRLQGISVSHDGIRISRTVRPVQSVACYVPGGRARYPSTLVMCAVPAKIAGVKRVVAISPPMKSGSIDPLTMVAADICGVDEFYKVGGAQGIAAVAAGTESIRPVSKIVGPGGLFVTAAKLLASSRVSTDLVAGPTELLVYCDKTTDPRIASLDLISQAEHSPDTVCGIVTTSEGVARNVIDQLTSITSSGIERPDIVSKSISENGFAAVCKDVKAAAEFINEFAPEHLEILSSKPGPLASKVDSAGLILVGPDSASSASDYCLGSNHVLPTLGFARSRGSLSVLDFLKIINVATATRAGLLSVEGAIAELTSAEGLPNHYSAVRERLVQRGKARRKNPRRSAATEG
ncbi:MAG: histidinol dehydrogenase [Nitrososphaera sp.]